jgi:site-specific recombinase XerD
MTTISEAIQRYLSSVSSARSEKTHKAYRFAMQKFAAVLEARNYNLDKLDVASLPEEAIAWFAAYLKVFTTATESLYLTAAKGFYDYLSAEGLASPNLPRIKTLIHQRARRSGPRLPQFPRESIERVIEYALSLASSPTGSDQERLRNLRDRAFLVTLADTGLRVHEACKLRRNDIDMFEQRAVVIGKGDKEAVVRFSDRAIRVLKDYFAARQALDGTSGRPIGSLPVFARHDPGAGKKVKPITSRTGQNIVEQRVRESLPAGEEITITPHSFRHYFVTTVLRGSGNLKLAQELARHRNIAVTQRYAHLSDDELDRGYKEIFDEGK